MLLAIEDANAASHDLVHGPGAHQRTLSALRAARAAGLVVLVETCLTRSNARSAAALADMLTGARVTAWRLRLARARGIDDAARRLPSLGVCVPHVLRGADRAARDGVEVSFEGLPLCVLGPFARWQPTHSPRGGAHHDGQDAHAAPCDRCTARDGCPGLAALHRARFGIRELRPFEASTQRAELGGPSQSLFAQIDASIDTPSDEAG